MTTSMLHVLGDVRLAGAVVLCVLLILTQQTQQTAQAAQTAQSQQAAQTALSQQAVQTAQSQEAAQTAQSQEAAQTGQNQEAAQTAQMRSGEHQAYPASTASSNNRHRRTVGSNPFQQLVEALQSDDITNADLYMHYTPSTPAPDDINCYVEVPTVLREGGRCIRLGRGSGRSGAFPSRVWACQAGVHLAFSPHCEHRARAGRGGRG